jgi:hypothetical protein
LEGARRRSSDGAGSETMQHNNTDLAKILPRIDLGSSVAELDNLLETARVETSVFD